MKTKRWTEERRLAQSELMKDRVITWGDKISIAKQGQGPSKKQAKEHSRKMRGRKKPPRSVEYRAKISENVKAQWAKLREVDLNAKSLAGGLKAASKTTRRKLSLNAKEQWAELRKINPDANRL